jgi:hypothetical protein
MMLISIQFLSWKHMCTYRKQCSSACSTLRGSNCGCVSCSPLRGMRVVLRQLTGPRAQRWGHRALQVEMHIHFLTQKFGAAFLLGPFGNAKHPPLLRLCIYKSGVQNWLGDRKAGEERGFVPLICYKSSWLHSTIRHCLWWKQYTYTSSWGEFHSICFSCLTSHCFFSNVS